MTTGTRPFRVWLDQEEAGRVRRLKIGPVPGGFAGFAAALSACCGRREAADPRVERAARWALDLDAQLGALVRKGREVTVRLPDAPRVGPVRAYEETPFAYRDLRLDTGHLLRPWLLDPPSLDDLYPFQRVGVDWLCGRFHHGAILADDMGLGKTVQVASALRVLFNRAEIRRVLVACPKSLLDVWEAELARWAPELGVAVLNPPARLRERAWATVAGRRHVLITNYEQLREPPTALSDAPVDVVVADEAHRLRNFGASVTAGVDRLPRRSLWALTGTPLERDLEDLATLLSLVAPNRFAPDDSRLHPSSLRSAAQPYILRRLKDEVLEELPPIVDTTEALDLNAEQARAYAATVSRHRTDSRPGAELALLTRLRALCDLHEESGSSSKLDRIVERLVGIRQQERKAVVFAYQLAPLYELERRICARWGVDAARRLVGSMGQSQRARAVREFRTDPAVLALVASSRVGGEGLTLVEANHVFLIDQWWNPSANDQARDRVVRIGQKRTVHVYRFCCRGTIEERLQEILEVKRELFEDAVGRLDVGAALKAIVREGSARDLIAGPSA
ncbi:MAG: DEAD/DEAH box helicase [Acidobacteria bacterium]|nr:DEAD/DEAH box helicase [Acidobacteriota bacterium]